MSHGFHTDISHGIGEIVIDRPPVNALNDAGWHALADEIIRVGHHPDARVIVLRGEGRGFCAGVDIKELDKEPERIISVNRGNYRSFEAVHRNPVPVIVAVLCAAAKPGSRDAAPIAMTPTMADPNFGNSKRIAAAPPLSVGQFPGAFLA